jgi:hypothetical protein
VSFYLYFPVYSLLNLQCVCIAVWTSIKNLAVLKNIKFSFLVFVLLLSLHLYILQNVWPWLKVTEFLFISLNKYFFSSYTSFNDFYALSSSSQIPPQCSLSNLMLISYSEFVFQILHVLILVCYFSFLCLLKFFYI